ncbi:response regulator [Paeniglutamicibacter sp. R2-26]|uniref:response regulator n=1 Tax=Paeniglutamicibacter sp. R2-26 TaxID=3144417 RepID=UPI003EE4FC49
MNAGTAPGAPVPAGVLLVDDHAAIRMGLRMVIESAPGFTVLGEAENGAAAVAMAAALRPDIVLMDLRMPVLDGVEATRQISGRRLSRVLVLTTFDGDEHLFGALEAGARGFLLKTADPRRIIAALESVLNGETVIAPEVAAVLVRAALESRSPEPAAAPRIDPREVLTERELEVLRELGAGHGNHSIGRRLGISETTVKTHVSRVLAKLEVTSRLQAALVARSTLPAGGEAPHGEAPVPPRAPTS